MPLACAIVWCIRSCDAVSWSHDCTQQSGDRTQQSGNRAIVRSSQAIAQSHAASIRRSHAAARQTHGRTKQPAACFVMRSLTVAVERPYTRSLRNFMMKLKSSNTILCNNDNDYYIDDKWRWWSDYDYDLIMTTIWLYWLSEELSWLWVRNHQTVTSSTTKQQPQKLRSL